MEKRFIYLAGPIGGMDEDEAKDWRDWVEGELKVLSERYRGEIVGISPLRCEPPPHDLGRYPFPGEQEYADPMFGTARAISAKNKMDVEDCHLTLAYMPSELIAKAPSYGTVIEMALARRADKPVILVTDKLEVFSHPVIDGLACSWKLATLEEALELIEGLYGKYVE